MTSNESRATASTVDFARLKAELLAEGMRLTQDFLARYGPPYLEKRRAYGNSDPVEYRGIAVPQEVYLEPDRRVCAVNIRPTSTWSLDYDGRFCLRHVDGRTTEVSFPRRPAFYDEAMADGRLVSQVITLYGGGSLGIFVYGNCALVDMNKACQYCSIQPNRNRGTDFEAVVKEEQIERALDVALRDESANITQVMINGGNFPDLDKSFRYYARMVQAARRAIDRSPRDVELHLIVFPPRDFGLFQELAGQDVGVAMNMEVFDRRLFEQYCPGKTAVAGQQHILDALESASRQLGPGHVFSIMLGGLEGLASYRDGLAHVAGLGAIPVVNIFHNDPETPLFSRQAPSTDQILAMGASLQATYRRHPYMKPFYMHCGRNSIDTEAYLGLFPEASLSGPERSA